MPNILLGGGPGTATQSMTLQAYIDWNTLNLGRSAAIAYLLLILVSVVATVYVSFVRRRVTDCMTVTWTAGTRSPAARSRTCRRPRSSGAFVLLLFWAFVVLFPIYWLFVTSFKTPYDVDKGPFYIPFVDFQPTLDAWRYILVELGNDTLRPYMNTVIVGLSSSIIALVMGSAAAYALVRFTYRPRVGMIGLGIGRSPSRSSRRPSARRWSSPPARRSAIFAILAQAIGRRFTPLAWATATSRSG